MALLALGATACAPEAESKHEYEDALALPPFATWPRPRFGPETITAQTTYSSVIVKGSDFTPGGRVHIQVWEGNSRLADTSTLAWRYNPMCRRGCPKEGTISVEIPTPCNRALTVYAFDEVTGTFAHSVQVYVRCVP